MPFFFKPILPALLKKDEFRLAFLSALHKAERGIKKDMLKPTAKWDHTVIMQVQISLKGGPSVKVWTEDEIYQLVNTGAPEHDIPKEPKTLGFLVYQIGYKAKTVPGSLTSKSGGKFGRYTKRKQVHHPGFVGRDFEGTVEEIWIPKWQELIDWALEEGARKSGHGINLGM